MKYIKLYESAELYKVIDREEYMNSVYGSEWNNFSPVAKYRDGQTNPDDDIFKFIKNNWSTFTESEIKKINLHSNMRFTPDMEYIRNHISAEKRLYDKFYGDYIVRTTDEWYYCSIGREYYKCDQFEGLIQLLDAIRKISR